MGKGGCKFVMMELAFGGARRYNDGMKHMKPTGLCALLVLLACAVSEAPAQSPDLRTENKDLSRVVRHPDGSRSIYKRQRNVKGMQCSTYTASGKLAAINDYHEGKYGQLVGCNIYNHDRQLIYKVAYGYDSSARLIEERMYSHPQNKLVQRVIYKYDSGGNRSKPLIISLNPGSSTTIAPTMREETGNTYRELGGRGK